MCVFPLVCACYPYRLKFCFQIDGNLLTSDVIACFMIMYLSVMMVTSLRSLRERSVRVIHLGLYFFLKKGVLGLPVQGSKFVVAMVANATMFSHLLPGCSCGSEHLLLP